MKGPYHRVKFDLRRIWECPVCKRRERTAGTVTFRHCQCQMTRLDGQLVVMKLMEDGMQRLSRPAVIQNQEPSQILQQQAPTATTEQGDPSTGY